MGALSRRETPKHKSYQMGMHSERLRGSSQVVFFGAEEEENFVYPDSFPVDSAGGPGFIRGGLNTLELRTRDYSGRVVALEVVFHVGLQ